VWGVASDQPKIYLDSWLKYDNLQILIDGLNSAVLIFPEQRKINDATRKRIGKHQRYARPMGWPTYRFLQVKNATEFLQNSA
jgi:hypothetical protein